MMDRISKLERFADELGRLFLEEVRRVSMQVLELSYALEKKGLLSADELLSAKGEVAAMWAVDSAMNPELGRKLEDLKRLTDALNRDKPQAGGRE